MVKVKVEIEMPSGPFCTGCPCSLMTVINGNFVYGCNVLHTQCKPDGEYQVRAIKDKKCPAKKGRN